MAEVGICLLLTKHDFDIVGLARKAEELGFGSLWAPEHGWCRRTSASGRPVQRSGANERVLGRPHQPDHRPDGVPGGCGSCHQDRSSWGRASAWCRNATPSGWRKRWPRWTWCQEGGSCSASERDGCRGEAEVLGSDFPRRWAQTQEYVNAMKELWMEPVSEFSRPVGGLPADQSAIRSRCRNPIRR